MPPDNPGNMSPIVSRTDMHYDFIIIGAGTSGCLLAGRLVGEGARVLLLEAGGSDRNMLIRMPAGFVKLLGVQKYMWFYGSTPQAQLGGRAPAMPAGRVVGGGSSVNAMVYIRGQSSDYDEWAEATGDEDWRYDRLLPRFRALEGNNRLQNAVHGIDGPMKVSDPLHVCDLSRAYIQAAQATGIPYNDDFNSGNQIGTGFFQLTTHAGRRWSAADAFLHPVMDTGRVDVLTGCLVHRVVVDNGRARGVEYSRGGRQAVAETSGEVIVCAGALATPKILMLSGIGPEAHLRAMDVPVAVDLPGVGANLQDHTEVPVLAFCKGRQGYFGQDRGLRQIRNGLQYLMFKSGPVTSNGVEAGSFFDPDNLGDSPKLQQFCIPSVYLDSGTTNLRPSYGLTINSCVLRPKSRGTVRLSSRNAADQPLVDPNYLADPEDLRLSIAGLRHARRVLAANPLREIVSREIFPGVGKDSDAELAAHARSFVKTVYHPVGTARMGRETDRNAVLLPDMRVKGVEGLRVADASVMPNIISGNTNATTLVVAERALDFILNRREPVS
jgi:choline dehydrogenase-like flavoprotein